MPSTSRYQAVRALGSLLLRKTPPRPVMRPDSAAVASEVMISAPMATQSNQRIGASRVWISGSQGLDLRYEGLFARRGGLGVDLFQLAPAMGQQHAVAAGAVGVVGIFLARGRLDHGPRRIRHGELSPISQIVGRPEGHVEPGGPV